MQTKGRALSTVWFAIATLTSAACPFHAVAAPGSGSEFSSFEHGMQGWRRRAIEVDSGGADGAWRIRRSRSRADTGVVSLGLYLRNFSDAGKVWVERAFRVRPTGRYRVRLDFAFGSNAEGEIGTFQIVAGAATRAPRSGEEIGRNARGSTYNGGVPGWVWLPKAYELEAVADRRGRLWIFIGIWGTFEVTQRYFIDSVSVALEPLPDRASSAPSPRRESDRLAAPVRPGHTDRWLRPDAP